MKSKIRSAFDHIHAEKALKDRTKAFLTLKMQKNRGQEKGAVWRLFPVVVCVCLLAVGIGGYRSYFKPVSFISIDINPSLELEINRFDRVISANGYNDDGQELVMGLDVRYMDYMDALQEVLEHDSIEARLSQDEILSIVVTGEDEMQQEEMLDHVRSCIARHKNAYCYQADRKELEEAHELGLSCGKYQAFLRIREVDPSISADEIRNMTMREIHDLMESLSVEEFHENLRGSRPECGTERERETGNEREAGNGCGVGNECGTGNGHGHGSGRGAGALR